MEIDTYKKYVDKINELFSDANEDEDEVRVITNEDIGRSFSEYFIEQIRNQEHFYLYRYCKVNEFLYESINNGELYLCDNTCFDDMYEGVPSFQTSLYGENVKTLILDENQNRIRSEYRDKSKAVKQFEKYLYIKCFSSNADNLPMWGIYADEFRGVCLRYDLKKAEESVLRHLFPVFYSKERCVNIEMDIESIDKEKNVYRYGVYKSDQWEFESEWRLIYARDELRDGEKINQIIKSDCLSAIYLGQRISEMNRFVVEQLAKKKNVPVLRQKMLDFDFGCKYE